MEKLYTNLVENIYNYLNTLYSVLIINKTTVEPFQMIQHRNKRKILQTDFSCFC